MSEERTIPDDVFEKIRRDAEEKRKVEQERRQRTDEFWRRTKGDDTNQLKGDR
jgi:ribosomal protein L32E